MLAGRSCTPNAPLDIRAFCRVSDGADGLLRSAITRLGLSARGYHRVLKIARTVADLDGAAEPRRSECCPLGDHCAQIRLPITCLPIAGEVCRSERRKCLEGESPLMKHRLLECADATSSRGYAGQPGGNDDIAGGSEAMRLAGWSGIDEL
jgi:magnesium chelatase subunit ChlI-like protein